MPLLVLLRLDSSVCPDPATAAATIPSSTGENDTRQWKAFWQTAADPQHREHDVDTGWADSERATYGGVREEIGTGIVE